MTASHFQHSRDVSIDYSRGVGIILVVFAHGLEISFVARPDHNISFDAFYIWRFIYSFHMPLFYFISGVVFDRTNKERSFVEVLQRCGYLIILALATHTVIAVMCILYHAVYGNMFVITGDIKDLFHPYIKGNNFDSIVVWFLISLSFVRIGAFLLNSNSIFGRLVLLIVISISILFIIFDQQNYWQIRSFAPGLLFFVLGMNYKQVRSNYLFSIAVISGCLCFLTAPLNHGCVLSFSAECPEDELNGNFGVWLISGKVGYVPLFMFTAITGIFAVHGFAQLAAYKIPHHIQTLSWVGRNSLELMIINGVCLQFINPQLKNMSFHSIYIFIPEIIILTITQIVILWPALPLFKVFENIIDRLANWSVGKLPLPKTA